ncbi:MAG: DUF3991 domain-containing protein [Acidobacteria bacterium]|nr:DUF3991 domain-containing protein [Acidobacteriota bacterium]
MPRLSESVRIVPVPAYREKGNGTVRTLVLPCFHPPRRRRAKAPPFFFPSSRLSSAMNFDHFPPDRLRAVPLETVLTLRGARRDPHDRAKWHTERGPLSVTGCKFMNWHQNRGGGGAIDLVMHLAGVNYGTALRWLRTYASAGLPASSQVAADLVGGKPAAARMPGALRLPLPAPCRLARVRQYLTRRRRLDSSLLDTLLQAGQLYADGHANAVFVLVAGKAQRPVGAELRGTGRRAWRGMASGSNKDLGYFWIGTRAAREIVLCESAIDAISCFQIHPQRICISTSGVRADPPWLSVLIAHGYTILCGFDADHPGDAAAARMIALHPTVRRLRPSAHDWNNVLTSSR